MKKNMNKEQEQNKVVTIEQNENKEGKEEKKMNNNEKMVALRTSMSLTTDSRNNTESILASDYLDSMNDMDKACKAYNDETIKAAFDEMITLSDLFKREHYSALYTKWDKKANAFAIGTRTTRLDALAFIDSKKVDKGDEFKSAVSDLGDALSGFIKSEVTYDGKGKKSVPVSVPVSALKKVMDIVGIEGIIARNRDARFLAYSCSGGSSSIGALRDITPNKVALALVDVYHVQLTKGAYAFESEVKKAEKASK